MFSVHRFDPRKENRAKKVTKKTKKKKSRRSNSNVADDYDSNHKSNHNRIKKKRKRNIHHTISSSSSSGGGIGIVNDDDTATKNHNEEIILRKNNIDDGLLSTQAESETSVPVAEKSTATSLPSSKYSSQNTGDHRGGEDEEDDTDNAADVRDGRQSIDDDMEVDIAPTATKAAATLQVIAPVTDGGVSTKKNLNTKISAEAFDDLDIIDEEDGTTNTENDGNGSNNQITDNDASSALLSSAAFDPTDEIERALEMARLPIVEAARRWGMADFLVRNLQSNGYEHFFPIQAMTIPDTIIAERHMTSLRIRDVCVAAPTGSGKTLAFVLPVLNALALRRVRRLRALVILPSRDLAQQVYGVFDAYRKGSENDLRIGLAIGQTDFKAEQKKLILGGDDDDSDNISNAGGRNRNRNRNSNITKNLTAELRQYLDPGNLEYSLDVMANEIADYDTNTSKRKNTNYKQKQIPAGGISDVDVLVCTPGRLIDHLDNTPGFTLQHLRWLVIDEADRLLSQSYHGWIQRVLDSVHEPIPSTIIDSDANNNNKISEESNCADCGNNNTVTIHPVTYRRSDQDAFIASSKTTEKESSAGTSSSTICQRVQLRKLLYSATLTKDPQKLSSLRLVNPKYFNAHDLRDRTSSSSMRKKQESSLYRMPDQLKECTIECTAQQKPIVLLALLLERLKEYEDSNASIQDEKKKKKNLIIVFTSSLQSTHRLTRLLQLLFAAGSFGTPPQEFSSALNQRQRSRLMERCNDPNDRSVSVLICSDGMSRGMDLASVVAVINYDVPSMAKTYVHRCGRTARAGQDGTAIAILKGKGQAGQFAKLRRLIAVPERVTKMAVKTSMVRDAIPLYKDCVSSLRDVLAAEDRNELKPMDPDLTAWLPSVVDGHSNNEDNANSSDSESSDSSSSSCSSSLSNEHK